MLGFATMLWFLLTLFGSAFKKLKHLPADANTALTLAAVLGVTGILVHSVVDFNLQIPANAALFYVLCTVAAMEPRFGRHHHRHNTRAARRRAVLPGAYDLRPQLSTRELEVK